eukprot:9780746-Prorocentrum_lima.AAC.1
MVVSQQMEQQGHYWDVACVQELSLGEEVPYSKDGHVVIRDLPRSEVSCSALLTHSRCTPWIKEIPEQETDWAVVDMKAET